MTVKLPESRDHGLSFEGSVLPGYGLGKAGWVTIYVDGQSVGEGRVEHTQPLVFSADETADVGNETGKFIRVVLSIVLAPARVRVRQMSSGRDAASLSKSPDRRYPDPRT